MHFSFKKMKKGAFLVEFVANCIAMLHGLNCLFVSCF